MANRAFGAHFDEQGVAVAIFAYFFHPQEVAGGFAFGPEAVFAATEKRDFAFPAGLLQRFGIHVAQHKDVQRVGVLDDNRNQAASFFKIQSHLNVRFSVKTVLISSSNLILSNLIKLSSANLVFKLSRN